jgi:hypothetical protein
MEKLEIEAAEFVLKPEMRCQGMCSGSCSCPTGHCKCKIPELHSLSSERKEYETLSSDSYQFKEAA